MNPILFVSGTVLVASLFYNGVLKIKVNGLNEEIVDLKIEVKECSMNNSLLKGAINSQNESIEGMRFSIDSKSKELAEWKNKPEKVRYNVIYKNIPTTISIEKEDCETTKETISAIRSINFNSL